MGRQMGQGQLPLVAGTLLAVQPLLMQGKRLLRRFGNGFRPQTALLAQGGQRILLDGLALTAALDHGIHQLFRAGPGPAPA